MPATNATTEIQAQRKLSAEFMNDLLPASPDNPNSGLLNPILERVKNDNTLLLCIREDYINIYYRGCNLLKITRRTRPPSYAFEFSDDEITEAGNPGGYKAGGFSPQTGEKTVKTPKQVARWTDCFPSMKQAIDCYLTTKVGKKEREFQQTVAMENTRSKIAKNTDYFLFDLEYVIYVPRDLDDKKFNGKMKQCKVDLVGIKRRRDDGRQKASYQLVFIEMKYGSQALDGDAGIDEHIKDFRKFTEDDVKIAKVTMETTADQLFKLGLLEDCGLGRIQISDDPPEYVLLLANLYTGSTKPKTISIDETNARKLENLRFAHANFLGYGLFNNKMLSLGGFLDEVKKVQSKIRAN